MQKPIQEYKRGLVGGYTSEPVKKITGGDAMNIPITANPLDLALKLSGVDKMLPKPMSALPEYVDPVAMEAIRTMMNVPLMGGGLGAQIKEPVAVQASPSTPVSPPAVSPSASIAQQREQQIAKQEEPKQGQAVSPSKPQSKADIRNIWTQVNSMSMSIPDLKRRHAFIANEIERMKAEGEIDEKSANVLHQWNNSINTANEPQGIDDRLLWLLMIASMFQR